MNRIDINIIEKRIKQHKSYKIVSLVFSFVAIMYLMLGDYLRASICMLLSVTFSMMYQIILEDKLKLK